jgi:hypothetical protein
VRGTQSLHSGANRRAVLFRTAAAAHSCSHDERLTALGWGSTGVGAYSNCVRAQQCAAQHLVLKRRASAAGRSRTPAGGEGVGDTQTGMLLGIAQKRNVRSKVR